MNGMARNECNNILHADKTDQKVKSMLRNACAPEYQIIVRCVLHVTFFIYSFRWLAESPLRREAFTSHVE